MDLSLTSFRFDVYLSPVPLPDTTPLLRLELEQCGLASVDWRHSAAGQSLSEKLTTLLAPTAADHVGGL